MPLSTNHIQILFFFMPPEESSLPKFTCTADQLNISYWINLTEIFDIFHDLKVLFLPLAFYADLFATSIARLASIFSVFSPWFIRASLKHGKYGCHR